MGSGGIMADVIDGEHTIPLFKAYPALKDVIPHKNLGVFPTPVIKAEKLGAAIGLEHVYIKNDGASGGSSFGGNKVRKLEFLLADALAKHATAVMTVGGAGSNHALATAAYASQLGLESFSMLIPQLPASYVRRNLLLSLYYGAHPFLFVSKAARDVGIAEIGNAYYEKTGQRIYFIPKGGSNEIGALGFVNAAFELKEQIEEGMLPKPDIIYVACGSKGTAVGLILGLKASGLDITVIPVCDEQQDIEEGIELLGKTNELLHTKLLHTKKKFGPTSFWPITKKQEKKLQDELQLNVNDSMIGSCYAEITPATAAAIDLVKQTEGIMLDGTYSGKACAAMIEDAKKGKLKGKTILLWDTYCSGNFESITSGIDYHQLRSEFYPYFEQPLQELDKGC